MIHFSRNVLNLNTESRRIRKLNFRTVYFSTLAITLGKFEGMNGCDAETQWILLENYFR